MCGIFFSLNRGSPLKPTDQALDALKSRGPDSLQSLELIVPVSESQDFHLTFASSVLALRGGHVQEQPLVDPASGSVLCWNGEAWKIDGQTVQGNDSTQVLQLLVKASNSQSPQIQGAKAIAEALNKIDGPFAFVFWEARTSTIYYGRDRLGRRSLLLHQSTSTPDQLIISSTAFSPITLSSSEVSTTSIRCLSLSSGRIVQATSGWQAPLPQINKDTHPVEPLAALPIRRSVEQTELHLKQAIRLRVNDIPDHSHAHLDSMSAKVAVLFSGGLDCTLLARLAHDVLPPGEPIDLLNVAFENPRSLAARKDHLSSPYESCPDRLTGRSTFQELQEICPGRLWRFVAIDIPYAESLAHQPTIIDLMYPHHTEMDLSIAMALYFAARGQGEAVATSVGSDTQKIPYTSTARVLLSGLGADELFAGYARHAAAFTRGGFEALADELELDFVRIGSRNLGRDDRVMSHWGKEVRYPFLDEDFVRHSLGLPVWEKSGFRTGRPIPKHYDESRRASVAADLEPGKLLLRLVMWDQGMKLTASERKRAIQFGAKTAKMKIGMGRAKGTDLLDPLAPIQ
ncbi:hypothetical protein PV10_08366 [Exophiala mesophila]|uniref:Glutamine amidotransferase type-2 domain-containing protein n=1 Tax=Exophiala mesophila TaxID=212818 RepID=A0A0D1ZPI8_EXOME|nr:uncharacterized protein PV10_08366 [Exophiala mesophila]KIV88708.1 hypothetical protein PV10_08366 [Exophiala mesophila]